MNSFHKNVDSILLLKLLADPAAEHTVWADFTMAASDALKRVDLMDNVEDRIIKVKGVVESREDFSLVFKAPAHAILEIAGDMYEQGLKIKPHNPPGGFDRWMAHRPDTGPKGGLKAAVKRFELEAA